MEDTTTTTSMMIDDDENNEQPSSTTQSDNDNDSDSEMLVPQYLPNERVFAKDANDITLYEAVIKKIRPSVDGKSVCYLIHYIGWNARWDTWLENDDLVPYNEENRTIYSLQQQQQQQQKKVVQQQPQQQQPQQQQQQQPQPQQQDDKENNTHQLSTASIAPSRKRRKLSTGSAGRSSSSTTHSSNTSTAQNNQNNKVLEEVCELPFTLKTVLIDEWEQITKRGFQSPYGYDYYASQNRSNAATINTARSVHSLPANVTIRKILNHFEKTQKQKILEHKQQQQQETAIHAAIPIPNDTASAATASNTTNKARNIKEKIAVPLAPEIVSTTVTTSQLHHFCQRLETLFEEALPVCLLYPQERPQYQHLIQKHNVQTQTNDSSTTNGQKRLADIYGCEYLLRLFVRLPTLLKASQKCVTASTTTPSTIARCVSSNSTTNNVVQSSNDDSMNSIMSWDREEHPDHYIYIAHFLNELMLLLQKNRQACFKGNYRQPTSDELLPCEKV